MDPETSRDVALGKYERAFKKLTKQIKNKDVSMIQMALEQVESTWKEFDSAVTLLQVKLKKNGQEEDAKWHEEELENLEDQKDTTVSKANKILQKDKELAAVKRRSPQKTTKKGTKSKQTHQEQGMTSSTF